MGIEVETIDHHNLLADFKDAVAYLMEVEDLLLWMDDDNPLNQSKFEEAINTYHRARETVKEQLAVLQ